MKSFYSLIFFSSLSLQNDSFFLHILLKYIIKCFNIKRKSLLVPEAFKVINERFHWQSCHWIGRLGVWNAERTLKRLLSLIQSKEQLFRNNIVLIILLHAWHKSQWLFVHDNFQATLWHVLILSAYCDYYVDKWERKHIVQNGKCRWKWVKKTMFETNGEHCFNNSNNSSSSNNDWYFDAQ